MTVPSTEAARQALERRVAWLLDHPRNIRQSDRDEVRDGFADLRERPSDAALVEALLRVRVAAERYADLELRACADPCSCGSAECELVLALAAAEFIANAPTDIGRLLAEVDRLRRERNDAIKGRDDLPMSHVLLAQLERAEAEVDRLRPAALAPAEGDG